MYVRTRWSAVVTVAAVAAALALAGCSTKDGAAPASSSGSGAAAGKTAPGVAGSVLGRDVVDGDVRKAIVEAGLDPAKGMTTTTRNGRKRPDAVDWLAVVSTAEAGQVLPKTGAALERAGWKPDRVEGTLLTYRKAGWSLLASCVPGGGEMPHVPEDSSMIQLYAHRLDGAEG
ncbi:hypothetical protein ACGFXC_33635 [Streptomyces sp. NPDC048507]|uniref:hypothetical protein n=1 Tax=Streptomyces sp. NPDC048507 TaxID=3365560 RepID=UPI003720F23B